jgi:hypothetical protein
MRLALLYSLRFVLFEPEGLGGHPLGADGAVAVVLERGVSRLLHPPRLIGGAHVHPHDGRPHVPVLLVHRQHRAARAVHGEANNLLRSDPTLAHRLFGRGHQARPPLVGVLLRPARARMLRFELDAVENHRRASGVEDAYPHTLRPEVDA